jgi:lysine/ornithine N-monooxygenase
MNKSLLLLTAGVLLAAVASAEQKPTYPAPAKPLKAEYTIYSGDLGDEQPPTQNERKLAVEVSGQGAKEIFDSIYPDSKVTCSDEKGERLRSKGNVSCSYTPRDGYRCFFGFNLRTGKSIAGGSC